MDDIQKLNTFENKLVVKNQLLMMTKEELVDAYQSYEEYEGFIITVISLLREEMAFLCIDESINEKIRLVLDIYKFRVQDDNLYEVINGLVKCLNEIDVTDYEDKKTIVKDYYEYHKLIRNAKFNSSSDFLYSLGYDAFVFLYLKGEQDLPDASDSLVLFSICYIIDACPEFFRNECVYYMTMDKLNSLRKNTSLFDVSSKIISSDAKKKVKKIFEEE